MSEGYWAWIISPEELQRDVDDLTQRVNSFSRKYSPFRIVVEQERLDPNMDFDVCRFSLATTSEFEVRDSKAVDFIGKLKDAAAEVERMNESNYHIVLPPRKTPGRP